MHIARSREWDDDPSGPLNPHHRGAKQVPLFSSRGRVWSVRKFASRHVDVLAPVERAVVSESLPELSDDPPFASPLSRSRAFALSDVPAIVASRSGARSAYLPEQSVKLKGCRPVLDGSEYPIEMFPLDAERISYSRVPFGVLTVVGAMREILAWCCWRRWKMEPHSTPLAVFEYEHDGARCGICLVSQTVGEIRIDEFLDYPACSPREVAVAAAGTRQLGMLPIGGEVPLRGVNLWWYAEEKARLLAAMHLRGGFRGVLNSNIGNDVIVRVENQADRLFLCDFDSFALCEVPDEPSRELLQRLVLHSIVEVVKGSISILDYAALDESITAHERRCILAKMYTEKSTLWRAYWRIVKVQARDRGWPLDLLENIRESTLSLEPAESVLEEVVLNSHYLRHRARSRGVFYPHN